MGTGTILPQQRRHLQSETPPTEEECGSPVVQWGDGVCDARLNTEACNYDGGESGNLEVSRFLNVSLVARST